MTTKNWIWVLIVLMSLSLFSTSAQKQAYRFYFDNDSVPEGFLPINWNSAYSEKNGFGFDFESDFLFSVKVPEGNYQVRLTFGDVFAAGELTVKAESRRLMLEKIFSRPGEFVTKSFIVNIRMPEISTGGKVRLKSREINKLDWDNKLTLEFNGNLNQLVSIEIFPVEDQITVFLAGNSTVVNQSAEPWASWGQMIPRFFKPGVSISNHAESGLTLASFRSQNRLQKILSVMKPGDYLFIEFGHNDQKMKGPDDGAYKSYSKNLKYFIQEAKRMQAYPVVVTPTARRRFNECGMTVNTLGDFPDAARKVAREEQVPLIDLNQMTMILYDALGVEMSKKAFVHYPANSFPGQNKNLADNTHFNSYGAYQIAKCVVAGILENDLRLGDFLIDMPVFDPAHPDDVDDFDLPQTPGFVLTKPDGN